MTTHQLKDIRLADITVEQLQALIREETRKALYDFMQDFAEYVPDPDERWEVKPEVYRKLHAYLKEQREIAAHLLTEDKPEATPLQKLIGGEMRHVGWEMIQELPDSDEGKELKPEFAEGLRKTLADKGKLLSLEEVKRELGLDE
jgi:hypothetical protein